MEPTLVTSYVNPDLDGVAGMVAYAEYLRATGTNAEAGIIGEPSVEAAYLLDRFGIPHPSRLPDAQGYERIVLVDASDPIDLEGAIPFDRVVEVIDHREVSDVSVFLNATVRIEPVGAAATLIAERCWHRTIPLSVNAAILLCGGIISNTRNLKADVTTDRDREALTWLNGIARLPDDFWRELFMAKSDVSGGKLAQRIRSEIKYARFGTMSLGIAELEMMGAQAVLTDRLSDVSAVLRGITREQELDCTFLVLIDLGEMTTALIADDEKSRALVSQALGAAFTGSVARLPKLLMRKQIVALLKRTLEP